mgnify:CR=1 FL=1
MSIKMAELMKRTGETKSTLLYYVKEGLLQEPSKPKPNVHLYSDESVQRVHLIKTLQNQLHYSITQIKHVFEVNSFDFENGVEEIVQKLDIFTGVKEPNFKTIQDATKVYNLDEKTILKYEKAGVIEINNGYFNDSTWKILQILSDLSTCSKSDELLAKYVSTAKELAVLEFELGAQLVDSDVTNNAQELFLDTLLSLKPYIFNLQTKHEHKRRTDA